jgi:hypothetical protein
MFLIMRSDDEDGDIDCVADAVNGFAVYDIAHKMVAMGTED